MSKLSATKNEQCGPAEGHHGVYPRGAMIEAIQAASAAVQSSPHRGRPGGGVEGAVPSVWLISHGPTRTGRVVAGSTVQTFLEVA